ncbi:MAG: ATP-binding protein [Xenococcaceae cyanobacterium MO_188.B19]|nr:ATP-binding protein [Xenococcaceae cyanobacterium MO_188.B19]
MKLFQLSFTTKIANYFLLLALITVGIVGGVAYSRAKKALEQAAFARLNVAATLKEEEISRWFEDQQRDFLLTTQMPDVKNNFNILVNSSSRVEKNQAYQVLSWYFQQVSQIKPSLQEIFILDRSNKIILSTNPKREGNYEILANITYVEEVKLGADFAPIFYVSPVTRQPAITLAKPLPQGMIVVDLNLDRIDQIVREKTGLGMSGETYLVGSLISKNSFIAGNSKNNQTFPDGINSKGIDAAMSGMSGYGLYRNYANSPVLGVYRWLNEQDIALLVEIDQEEAFYPANQLATTIILVGLVSVFGLLIGVNWLSKQLHLSRKQLEDYSNQLQVKAQEAETANRAKSLFLANMSHELRTPLNAILGFSNLMARDTSVSSEQKEYVGIINRSGEHLLNLINDVLEMSKIEAGKTTLNPEPFNLNQLLQTIQEMFQIKAQSKKLWFEFILSPNLPQYVISDPRKLRQSLINLLSNAVKFTSSGGVTLKALICRTDSELKSNQAQLCFEVSDTGKGIAPEELDKLFDPFVQTASGIQSESGTGLGLAITKQFIKLMGGDIQIASILGEGSTFTFDIKVLLTDSSEVKSVAPKRQVKKVAPGQKNYRIAVVDDQETNRQLLTELLQSVGFEIRTANNGQEAIALWQEWLPDLIWMDMRMPIIDGYEATQQIKSLPEGDKTIIIALTASAFEEQKDKVLSIGCDDFIRKPFAESLIFEKMTEYLGVEYIFEETSPVETTLTENTTDALDLSSLPSELITKIRDAAIAVDGEQIEQLLAHIPADSQNVAEAIKKMIGNYDFDGIIELTE